MTRGYQPSGGGHDTEDQCGKAAERRRSGPAQGPNVDGRPESEPG